MVGDRKLQPSKTVTCSYFFYTQREEDRVNTASSTASRKADVAGYVSPL